jgi:hypothetical protein
LLGFVAGEMAWEDGAIASSTQAYPPMMKYAVALVGAAFVVGLGRILVGRNLQKAEEERMNPGVDPKP